MDDWYDLYEDYQDYLASGGTEPEQDNPSDDWEESWLREINEYDDQWYEYNAGLSDYIANVQMGV